MPVRFPQPQDLEPIERASRDELRAVQLQRLKCCEWMIWSWIRRLGGQSRRDAGWT